MNHACLPAPHGRLLVSTFTVCQVSVWLDRLDPSQGAFAHALEWASHLGLPLRAVPMVPDEHTAERLETCKKVCSRQGVAWEPATGEDDIQPTRLHVVGSELPKRQQELLYRRVLQSTDNDPPAATLVGVGVSV